MTLKEAKRALAEAKLRVLQKQMAISNSYGPRRMQAQQEWFQALQERSRLKLLVDELNDVEHVHYAATQAGIEAPDIDLAQGRATADMLLLEALHALVELGCEWDIVNKLRAYFRDMPSTAKPDNSDLDFSRSSTPPSATAEESELIAVKVPPATPSPVRYLDAKHRAPSGPGTILYKRARG